MIIDRLNRHEQYVEFDVLPREDEIVTSHVIRRALRMEAKLREDSPHPETKASGPKGWKVDDVDIGLAGFNSDGSVRFVCCFKYTTGSLW